MKSKIKKEYYDPFFKRTMLEVEYVGSTFKIVKKINNRYVVTGILASGGTGIIYTAQDEELFNKKVLIKAPKYSATLFEHSKNRSLEEEVKKSRSLMEQEELAFYHAWYRQITGVPTILGRFKDVNPNIYGPHKDVDTGLSFTIDQEELYAQEEYLVLSYIDGAPLSEPLSAKRINPFNFTRYFLKNMARMLKLFHFPIEMKKLKSRISMIYIDLKPDNIIASKGGGIVLIDLGSFSFVVDEEDIFSSEVRTPGYSAPEIVDFGVSLETLTPAADVFSLGAITYELLTGDRPIPSMGESSYSFDLSRVQGREKDKKAWVPFLQKMLDYFPEKRFKSMDELIDHIPYS